MQYRVVWEIDVEADSPEEAAREARRMQAPGTTASYFTVIELATGHETEVDLEPGIEEDPNHRDLLQREGWQLVK